MKNILKLMFVLLLGTFSSCETDNNIDISEPLSIFKNEVTTPELTNAFNSLQSTLKSSPGLEFDNSHIYEVALDENSASLLMVNQTGYDVNNTENYGLSAVRTDDGLINPFIVKTQIISSDLSQIDYYDINFELIFSVQLNSATESINIIYQRSKREKGMGQDVVDCLGDVYSNHGWISLWAIVQTAYIPATAVALGAACVLAQ